MFSFPPPENSGLTWSSPRGGLWARLPRVVCLPGDTPDRFDTLPSPCPCPARCARDHLHRLPCWRRRPATDPGLLGSSWDEPECFKARQHTSFRHSCTVLASLPSKGGCVTCPPDAICCLFTVLSLRVCSLRPPASGMAFVQPFGKCPFCPCPGAGLPRLPLPAALTPEQRA